MAARIQARPLRNVQSGQVPAQVNWSPLYVLSRVIDRRDRTDLAHMLVRAGANVDGGPSFQGVNALLGALENDQPELALYLIDQGAHVNAQSGRVTALHLAVKWPKVVRALLGHRASVFTRDTAGNTPLHYAVAVGGKVPQSVQFQNTDELDGSAGNPTPRFSPIGDGKTFLFGGGNDESVRLLMNAGAEVNAHNANGETPLYWAVFGLKPEVLIQKSGQEAQIAEAWFPEDGNIEVIKALIDAGAGVNLPDQHGKSPFKILVWTRDDVKQLLRAHAIEPSPDQIKSLMQDLANRRGPICRRAVRMLVDAAWK
jgi:ankyrin repeat protein